MKPVYRMSKADLRRRSIREAIVNGLLMALMFAFMVAVVFFVQWWILHLIPIRGEDGVYRRGSQDSYQGSL